MSLGMGPTAERRDARERVIAYYQASLATLVEHVAVAIDGYRAGELDTAKVDEVIYQYHRAARELWKFCLAGGADLDYIADTITQHQNEGRAIDWWQRGAPRNRKD